MTFAEYMTHWLTEYVQDRVAERTGERYEGIVRNHLVPAFGEMALEALTSARIQSYLREKVRAGRLKGGGLSPSTVHQHHRVLHKALECAVDLGLIDKNPASRASPPRIPPGWIRVLDEEATKTLLRGLRGHALYLPCVIAAVKPSSVPARRATRTTTWSSRGPTVRPGRRTPSAPSFAGNW